MGRSIDAFADSERVAFYRNLSLEALRRAQAADCDAQKYAYLEIAQSWNSIADDVERLQKREADLAASLARPAPSNRPY